MKTVSQSSLKKKSYCNMLQYEYELPNFQSPFAFEKGTIIHEMLENLVGGVIGKYSKIRSEYRGTFKEYKHNHDFLLYELIVKKFYNEHKELFIKGKPEVEMNTMLTDDVMLSGVVDRFIQDGEKATLIDWKTGAVERWVVNPNKGGTFIEKILETLQAKVYTYLLLKNYPEINYVDFVWYYIEMGRKVTISYTREDLKTLHNEIMFVYLLSIEKGFNVTPQCKKCTKMLNCPFFKSLGKFDNNVDKLSPEDLYKKKKKVDVMLTNLKAMQDKIKTALIDKTEGTKEVKTYFNNSVKNYVKIDKNVPRELLLDLLGEEKAISKAELVEIQLKYSDINIIKKESKRWKKK